jgi:hypothetical protein
MCSSWSVVEDTAEMLMGVLLSGSLVFSAVTTISPSSFEESLSAAKVTTAVEDSAAAINAIRTLMGLTLRVSVRD